MVRGSASAWIAGSRTLGAVVVTCSLVLFSASATVAHNGWIQPSQARLDPGDMVFLDLQLGNHSNDHRSYRLAAKWDMKTTWVGVVGPDGKIHQLTSRVVDLGEDEKEVPPKGIKGYHAVRFVPSVPGTHIVWAVGDAIVAFGGPTFRSHRNAKTILAVGDPAPGFDRALATEGLEIVPRVHPASLRPGDRLPLTLLLHGRPAPEGTGVAIVERESGWTEEVKTNANGEVEFTVPAADYYLIRARIEFGGPLHGPAQAGASTELQDRQSFEGTLVIQVSPRADQSMAFPGPIPFRGGSRR